MEVEEHRQQQKKENAATLPALIEEWRLKAKEEEKEREKDDTPLLAEQEDKKPMPPEERRRAFVEAANRGFSGSITSLLSSLSSTATGSSRSRPCLRRWRFSFSRWPLRFLRLDEQRLHKEQPFSNSASTNDEEDDDEEDDGDEELDEQVARDVEQEETRERVVMLANLLAALILVCSLTLPLRLYIDGWNHLNSWAPLSSLCVYACLLWCARWWNDHGRTAAWLSCLCFNILLIYRCLVHGVRTETFSWITLLPLVVFCLLGFRAGVVATFGLVGESLLFYYFTPEVCGTGADTHNGQAFDLACVQMNHEQGTVFVPFACAPLDAHGAHVGRFTTSLEGLLMSKVLMILFLGVFAYVYESNRRSALKRMRIALQQKERVNLSLQQATKAKTAFLANMSHELRTPMHGIIAMAKDLMEMQLSECARESARIISDCADHLLGLVNDILDFARIESNQLELESIPLSVVEEVDKAVNLHAAIAKKKCVALITEIDIAQPLRLGDPLRFRQILINLLSNAVKFTPAEGRVTVSASSSFDDPEIVSVSVADTGIGIPAQGLENIFKSFSQLDASVGRKFGGSGLGLAISKKLCLAMRGDIRVESEEGQGSVFTFTVRLPLAPPGTPLQSPLSPRPALDDENATAAVTALMQGRKVLVVEDNAINQKVATKMLTSLGCSVTIADNGGTAVALFERETFDVILMDVQMPIMDGFQATARIRDIEQQRAQSTAAGEEEDDGSREEKPKSKEIEREEEVEEEASNGNEDAEAAPSRRAAQTVRSRVPIVALTASATRDYEAECLERGMDRFLTKPFRKETLQTTLIDIFLRPSSASSPSLPAAASPPSSPLP